MKNTLQNWESKFDNKLNLSENDYKSILPLIEKDEKNFKKYISVDIPRTLSEEFTSKNPDFAKNFEEVLMVFCYSNNIGYISGISFIAKMILALTNDKVKTFILLRNIFENNHIKDIYANKIDNICNLFEDNFKKKIPELYEHFKGNNVDYKMYIISWLKTLFCFDFNDKICEILFKIFIIKNDFEVYINAILAVLTIYKKELLSKKGYELLSYILSLKNVEFEQFKERIKEFYDIDI